jgi:multidrug resistance efflux pump
LIALADLREIELVAYVPEAQLGQVHVGDAVQIQVDSYPGRTYAGTVTHVAEQAEFTPRNVSTQEERESLVYAVRVAVSNADRSLKPGMPADASFVQEGVR